MSFLFTHPFLGPYIVQIARMFTKALGDFKTTDTSPVRPLKVYYGSPRSAFRHILEQNNSQMILPALNFFATDYSRLVGREPANRQLRIGGANSFNNDTKKISVTQPPMQFEVTYQFSLFCNNQREMYSMLHKIFSMFPKGEASIPWYPDSVAYPETFLWMPLRWDLQIQDTTELEGFDTKETKDITKNTFSIISQMAVPYELWEVEPVLGVALIEFVYDAVTGKLNQNFVYSKNDFSGGFQAGTFHLDIKLFNPA